MTDRGREVEKQDQEIYVFESLKRMRFGKNDGGRNPGRGREGLGPSWDLVSCCCEKKSETHNAGYLEYGLGYVIGHVSEKKGDEKCGFDGVKGYSAFEKLWDKHLTYTNFYLKVDDIEIFTNTEMYYALAKDSTSGTTAGEVIKADEKDKLMSTEREFKHTVAAIKELYNTIGVNNGYFGYVEQGIFCIGEKS